MGIDPKLIPESVWEASCRALNDSVRLALSDPELKREYEEWAKTHDERGEPI